MTREDLATRVLAWLLERGASGWIEAGGPSRLELCEQWRNVAAEYGAESPPAIGSLLALVREAWGDDGIVPIKHSRGGVGWDCCDLLDPWRDTLHATEALALLAALEAAPQ